MSFDQVLELWHTLSLLTGVQYGALCLGLAALLISNSNNGQNWILGINSKLITTTIWTCCWFLLPNSLVRYLTIPPGPDSEEQLNRILVNIIAKLSHNDPWQWVKHLHTALMVSRI